MAEDPLNQRAFAEDVAAAAAAGGDEGFALPPGSGPGSAGFQMPTADEIWKMVESMDGITDDERAELRESIFNPKAASPDDLLKYGQPGHSSKEYIIFFVMLALILLVFALFGFKLYKSLTEKELKKQEKLRSKQQKKSKKSN
ncbi:uncharacterized protein LOC6578485 isoform X1 [Drosophila mojavensis]|uniref:Uncharacterized protein, isoform B n=1 Tax=Drosophila mojavensis TaxID=7230 RepID=A0A0Q9X9F2_DROMO|nr:uncharacterized protein LOC6578485 isoform X1 [Drosophila mojavensis]XP_015018661.1 uncharacterized protein LOC6578485 isoform X1 [Drosophila mojavensis]KRG04055.1 uncharacterized protein Dmoj_GI19638, isoform B [Drosophila mojavensis]KRG04057.1 uncharacterized protein Dmoj_GI19638, isoform D [Drosophila mojavensis]